MDRDKIIDGLKMTMELCVFDPSTGEEIEPHLLNDINRATYDACKGALEILERLDTDSDTISRQAAMKLLRDDWQASESRGDAERAEIAKFHFIEISNLPAAQPEPCEDTISRQAAIETVMECYDNDELFEVYEDKLRELPPAQPERIKGRWTRDNACSECGCQPWFSGDIHNYNFCPNCGAQMEVAT